LDYRLLNPANDRQVIYKHIILETPPWELFEIFNEIGSDDDGNDIEIPIFVLLTPQCGNCNSFASNIRPDFWED
jgi:hypothetical protein